MDTMELMRCHCCGKFLGCDCAEKAAAAERAKVVAWLRLEAGRYVNDHCAVAVEQAADAIEALAHHKEEG